MKVASALFLIICAAAAVMSSDDLSTFGKQFLGVLLPSVLDPAHEHVLPRLQDSAAGYSREINSSGYFADVDYYDSSDRSDWAAAEHLRRCLIFGIASRSDLSALYLDSNITASARLCLGAWLKANFYSSNW